ncbi:MAG TPA: hypothetical protein VK206_15930 [Anaerolineales bacterium]|nr:hypothetical protein [Anaerolineales bacterium]
MDSVTWVLLYLLLPIFLGILGNLLTPWARSYIDKGSLSIRDRRLYLLCSRYDRVKRFALSPERFGLWMMRRLASAVFYLIILTFGIGTYRVAPQAPLLFTFAFMYVGAVMGILRTNEIFTIYSDVMNFDDYRKKTIEKIKKLGGNPEDLDKEEA